MDDEMDIEDDGPDFYLGSREGPSPFTNWLSPDFGSSSSSRYLSSNGPTPSRQGPSSSSSSSSSEIPVTPLIHRGITPQLQTPPPPRLGTPPSWSSPSPSNGRRRARGPFRDSEVESFIQESQRRRVGLVADSDNIELDASSIMALFYQKQQLAVSIFNVEDTTLHVCQFHYWPQSGECALLENLILEHRVTKIAVPSNLDKGLMDEIGEILTQVSHVLQVSPVGTKEFSLESSLFRVRMLHYSNQDLSSGGGDFLTPFDDLSALDDPLIIRSVGALMSFALKELIVNELEGASSPIIISEIKLIDSTGRLLMDIGSYDSLQIFKVEHHPSVSGIGVKKEGLSLFGIMDRTRSPIGKKLLRKWFLSPVLDLDKRKERLAGVRFFLNPDRVHIVSELQQSLKGVKDVMQCILRLKVVRASLSDWVKLFQTLVNSLKITEMVQSLRGEHPIFDRITNTATEELLALTTKMYSVLDFDESQEQKRLIPRDGFDPELDKMRHTYNGLEGFLTDLGEEELEKLSFTSIGDLRCVYYPQIGFQLAIPRDECEHLIDPEMKSIPKSGLEFQFLTSTYAYFKNSTLREADNKIGDIYCNIIDYENGIIRELEKEILLNEKPLSLVLESLAELDCLISLAVAAHDHNFREPEIVEQDFVEIVDGRHPIQELCVPQFIPNDINFSETSSFIKFITGPNFSGKSVLIKQVGIIVFLAHIGSFVPAKSAIVGLTDRIFTRISSRETVSIHQSSFFLDCAQMANMVKNATAKSLLLIDEFGKGTENLDGRAILTASLNEFLRRPNPPKVLLATHCLDLLSSSHVDTSLNQPQPLTMSIHMEQDNPDDEEVVYLYKLIEGTAVRSHGRHVALMAGVPEELVDRAESITQSVEKGEPIANAHSHENEKLRYRDIVDLFAGFDCEKGDIDEFLAALQSMKGD